MTDAKRYFCYILTSRRNGTLYVGVTGDLGRRVYEHKGRLAEGFSREYGVRQLVWYEGFEDVGEAILREKQIKKWNRAWKLRLIEAFNPDWVDLYDQVVG